MERNMSDPALKRVSELPAKPDRTLKDRGDRFGLVVASAAFAGVVVLAVLYTLMSERLKPTPKPSAESSQTTQATAPPASK
jgi:hypothetical protein